MKPWQKRLLWAASLTAAVYGMVYADVVMRAKSAYQEGEKYWRWAEHPEERQQFLAQKLEADKAALEARRSQGTVSAEDYRRQEELLHFGYEQSLKESNMKYAYFLYE